VLEPFYRIHDARYMIYWRVVSPEEYNAVLAAMSVQQQESLQLDRMTIDRVIPAEQQPEVEHNFKSVRSETGVFQNLSWRHAEAPGWFSYELRVEPDQSLALAVRYWGNEAGNRTFDILIDGQKLITENITGKWNRDEFVFVRYPIASEMLRGKQQVTVTFKPHAGNLAGGIFDLRIVKIQ
jgi:hypothetical protein